MRDLLARRASALPVLRGKERRDAPLAFRTALFGAPFAVFCVALSIVLASRMIVRETVIMLTLFVLATIYWLATGRTRTADSGTPYASPTAKRLS